MKRFLLILTALLLPMLATSCALSVMDRQAYALCMSIDLEEDGRITVGIFSPMSSDTDEASAAQGYTLFTGTGDTLPHALTIASASTACRINFSQLKLCILGKELASTHQLRPLLRQIVDLHDMRPECIVMVSLTTGQDVLKAVKPDFGLRLSTYLNQNLQRLQDAGLSPKSTLVRCVRDLAEDDAQVLLAICSVNQKLKKDSQSQSSSPEGGQQPAGESAPTLASSGDPSPWQNVTAGDLPRTGMNPVEFPGCALVENGLVTQIHTAEETQRLLFLLGQNGK